MDVVKKIQKSVTLGGFVHAFGNGGSCSITSHFLLDLHRACNVPVRWHGDLALATCLANDYGYDNHYASIAETQVGKKDVVFLISSSGNSENILNILQVCRKAGVFTVGLTGFSIDNRMASQCDINFHCDFCNYNVVESVHSDWLLSIVEMLKAGIRLA